MLGERLQGREHQEAQSGELLSGGAQRGTQGESRREKRPLSGCWDSPHPTEHGKPRMTKTASRSESACQPRIRGFQPHRMDFHVGKCQGPEANPEDERNREGAEWSAGSALECLQKHEGQSPTVHLPMVLHSPSSDPWQEGEREDAAASSTEGKGVLREEGIPERMMRMRTTVEQ